MTIIHSNLIWENHDGEKKLFIKSNNEEKSTHNNLMALNPYTSKLAAALFNGLEIFPIQSNSRIILDDEYSKIVLEQICNISANGKIHLLEKQKDEKILYSKNVEIIRTLNNSTDFLKNNEMVDVLYLDPKQNENILEKIVKYQSILKQNGFLIFLYNYEYYEEQDTKKNLQNILNKLKETFVLIQEINLSDFFKSSFMVIMSKK
jgi:fibrillarin-like rRNA methylase